MSTKTLFLLIIQWFLLVFSGGSQSSFMSFNIRYDNKGDMENSWDNRKEELAGMVKYYNPDLLGIQEGLYNQVMYLDEMLPEYDWIGKGRNDGKTKGEFSAIFYKKEKWENIFNTTIWLSETPDSVSKGWDAALERIATMGLFRNLKNKDTIFVINSHFDHIGNVARQKSAELILDKITKMGWNQYRGVVMGDVNSQPFEEPVLIFSKVLKDAFLVADSFTGPVGTFNAFNILQLPDVRIDYIFTQNMNVLHCQHIDVRRNNNLYLSDHLPVFVIMEAGNK